MIPIKKVIALRSEIEVIHWLLMKLSYIGTNESHFLLHFLERVAMNLQTFKATMHWNKVLEMGFMD